MEDKTFSLGIRENNKVTKVFQLIFGTVCIAISIFWLLHNFKSVKEDGAQWITVAFLCGFGAFQIYSGLGWASRFIEFGTGTIRLKNNSLLPSADLSADNIEKIEVFPLKVHIFHESSKKILIRFGVTDIEKVELIKDEIMAFATINNIDVELKNE
jgi:hypothetical protein